MSLNFIIYKFSSAYFNLFFKNIDDAPDDRAIGKIHTREKASYDYRISAETDFGSGCFCSNLDKGFFFVYIYIYIFFFIYF